MPVNELLILALGAAVTISSLVASGRVLLTRSKNSWIAGLNRGLLTAGSRVVYAAASVVGLAGLVLLLTSSVTVIPSYHFVTSPIETYLSIAGFALSLGALLFAFVRKDRMRETVLVTVVAALTATSGIALLRHHQEEELVTRAQEEILSKLSNDALTFDQLYQELNFPPFPVVNEALFRAVERGAIGYRVVEFKRDGAMLAVRLYYVRSRQGP